MAERQEDPSDSVAINAPEPDSLIIKDTLNAVSEKGRNPEYIYVLGQGETLWDLCTYKYQNRHYSKLILLLNKIPDPTRLRKGDSIYMPPMDLVLKDTAFHFESIEKEIDHLLKARELYLSIERTLWETRRDLRDQNPISIPDSLSATLKYAAAHVDSTIASLTAHPNKPRYMIDQLQQVSKNLKSLSEGSNDGYGYDLDMVHQNLISALAYGKRWK